MTIRMKRSVHRPNDPGSILYMGGKYYAEDLNGTVIAKCQNGTWIEVKESDYWRETE